MKNMKYYVQCPDCKSVKLIDVQDPLFCDHCKKWFSGDEYVILSALSIRQPWSFLKEISKKSNSSL